MKWLLPLVALWTWHAEPALAFTESEDAGAIMRAVILREAEQLLSWSQASPTCVSAEVRETTLDDFRRARGRLTRQSDGRFVLPQGEVLLDPFPWSRQPPNPDDRMIELQAGERQELAGAVAAILDRAETPPLLRRIERDWLPRPFHFCRRTENRAILHLRSPAIHGDVAFVAVDFECVLCGHGIDYALRRRGGNWEIIAEITRWVS